MIPIPQEESTLKAGYLKKRRTDRYHETEPSDARLDLTAEVAHDPQVGIRCRKEPHVPTLIELSGQFARARYRKGHGSDGADISGIDVSDALNGVIDEDVWLDSAHSPKVRNGNLPAFREVAG
jgi:hypothetical protein